MQDGTAEEFALIHAGETEYARTLHGRVVGGPYLVHRYFAGFLIHADLCHLCGIRIRRRRPDSAAFVFATTRRDRRRVRASAGQRPVEVNRRDDSLLEAHMLLRTIRSEE